MIKRKGFEFIDIDLIEFYEYTNNEINPHNNVQPTEYEEYTMLLICLLSCIL